jgi:hypothetical protein
MVRRKYGGQTVVAYHVKTLVFEQLPRPFRSGIPRKRGIGILWCVGGNRYPNWIRAFWKVGGLRLPCGETTGHFPRHGGGLLV